jgi:hypothetical protein
MMLYPRWQAEPWIDRLLPYRIAWRREGRPIECPYRDPADRRIAVAFPIERAAAIRAEVKPDAMAAVGIAFIDPALAVEPHPLFQIGCAKMERGAGSALARLAMAQINPFRLTRGDHAKRAAMALTGSFHLSHPSLLQVHQSRILLYPIFSKWMINLPLRSVKLVSIDRYTSQANLN